MFGPVVDMELLAVVDVVGMAPDLFDILVKEVGNVLGRKDGSRTRH